MAGPDGWTTVVGLHWIDQETTTLGTAPESDLVLPPGSAPARVGILRRQGAQLLFQPLVQPEVRVRGRPQGEDPPARILPHDDDGRAVPEVVESGRLRWWILRRGDRLAVRVKDPEAPARRRFPGLPCFPWDSRWRLEARLEAAEPGSTHPIRDLTGLTRQEPLAGRLIFSREGRQHRLLALADRPAGDLFILFRDQTSGRETYGPGRFLHVPLPGASGRTWVDFNRAYHPPCAFTAYATCPRPPAENSLALRVTAGERSDRGGEHST
ncbi:MAG: DUF1684 domain-containing protein [Verrucomicrobiota bacterium]